MCVLQEQEEEENIHNHKDNEDKSNNNDKEVIENNNLDNQDEIEIESEKLSDVEDEIDNVDNSNIEIQDNNHDDISINRIPRTCWKKLKSVHNALVGHNGVQRMITLLEENGHDWKYRKQHNIYSCLLKNVLLVRKMIKKDQ